MTARVGLSSVRCFVLDRALVESCIEAMRSRGREGAELFVALAGTVSDDGQVVALQRGIVPRQQCLRTRHGLLVRIESEALFELNQDLYANGELLAAQIHSHPDTAYHSEADDELALVQLPGGISIVVPHFARAGLEGVETWSVHRLEPDGTWGLLPTHVEVRIV
jgi:hypothetical protein